MLHQRADRLIRALAALREQFAHCSKSHPNDGIEVFTPAEPRPESQDRRADVMDVILTDRGGEEREGYGFLTENKLFYVEYHGQRSGFDEFVGLAKRADAVIGTEAEWDEAHHVGSIGLASYLGLWRPTLFLQTGFNRIWVGARSPDGVALVGKEGLVTVQLTLEKVFLGMTDMIDWMADPTGSLPLRPPMKYPVQLLPHWEAMSGFFEDLEAGATGIPSRPAKPTPRAGNGLIVEPFFVERGGERCELGNTMPYKLIAFLHLHLNRFVSAADVGEGAWGNDMAEADTIKKTARNANRLLRAAKIPGVFIDTSQREHLRLVVE